jgi:hypothetical protein
MKGVLMMARRGRKRRVDLEVGGAALSPGEGDVGVRPPVDDAAMVVTMEHNAPGSFDPTSDERVVGGKAVSSR